MRFDVCVQSFTGTSTSCAFYKNPEITIVSKGTRRARFISGVVSESALGQYCGWGSIGHYGIPHELLKHLDLNHMSGPSSSADIVRPYRAKSVTSMIFALGSRQVP